MSINNYLPYIGNDEIQKPKLDIKFLKILIFNYILDFERARNIFGNEEYSLIFSLLYEFQEYLNGLNYEEVTLVSQMDEICGRVNYILSISNTTPNVSTFINVKYLINKEKIIKNFDLPK